MTLYYCYIIIIIIINVYLVLLLYENSCGLRRGKFYLTRLTDVLILNK